MGWVHHLACNLSTGILERSFILRTSWELMGWGWGKSSEGRGGSSPAIEDDEDNEDEEKREDAVKPNEGLDAAFRSETSS